MSKSGRTTGRQAEEALYILQSKSIIHVLRIRSVTESGFRLYFYYLLLSLKVLQSYTAWNRICRTKKRKAPNIQTIQNYIVLFCIASGQCGGGGERAMEGKSN